MIFVRDKGRMCNNMLQYGHVYAWAREHGKRTVSMRFAYKYPYFYICTTAYHNFLTYVTAKYLAKWNIIPTVSFNDINEDTTDKERMMMESRNIMVEGWCVRFYDLFIKYKQEILDLFAFKPLIAERTQTYISSVTSETDLCLGVHIRRGDYKTWKDGLYYYEDNVYISYIQQFSSLYKDDRRISVFICGNDPTLDQNLYRKELSDMNVIFPAGSPGEDLCLLSECDYLIGAPSTFSLVAAMYNDLPLCWIYNKEGILTKKNFRYFDYLFKHIE